MHLVLSLFFLIIGAVTGFYTYNRKRLNTVFWIVIFVALAIIFFFKKPGANPSPYAPQPITHLVAGFSLIAGHWLGTLWRTWERW